MVAPQKTTLTPDEVRARQQREAAALARFGMSGRVGDLPLDLRKLAVVVADLIEQQGWRK